jgi:hypothetical protein
VSPGIVYAPGSAPLTVVSDIAGVQSAEYTHTVPSGVYQRLLSMYWTYVASATVGQRFMGFRFQGQDGSTTVVGAQTFPLTTLNVASTVGFSTGGGNLSPVGITGVVRYTGITPTSFTGITGSGSGTAADGATVTPVAPYVYMAGFPTNITAGQTANVSISPRAPQAVTSNTAQAMAMHCPNVWLWPGSTIATFTSNGSSAGFLSGDQYTVMNLFLEQVPIDSAHVFP